MAMAGVSNVNPYGGTYEVRQNPAAKESATADKREAAANRTANAPADTLMLSPEALAAMKENESTAAAVKKATTEDGTVDCSSLVKAMKEEQNRNQEKLIDMVRQMLGQQGEQWRLSGGEEEEEPLSPEEIQAQAQKNISEDGYWGVKQTSERIFNFAIALSGGDVATMHKLQAAVAEGYKQAGAAWGGELPGIAGETIDSVDRMFEDYFKQAEA